MQFSISLLIIPCNLPIFLLLNWIPTRSMPLPHTPSHLVVKFYVVNILLPCRPRTQIAAPPGHPLLDEDENFQGFIASYENKNHRFFDGDNVSDCMG